ncbi:16S rRNA (cytosine(967)-C(5))-methyltransferase RsmB [Entomomonas asaccharolytica]|uniref:16S rRNA (cytosine(967)-C(5))-methyltransferase n=1 Tax=Entomomonas asaccharolytica TaxID=2785331 RepID=A0A974RXP3_9GAMM|nr:16S rRNA (cytosine(967)-C(5))-methyltransferase RsmB [Entomomonas asaccharolytica]QQP86362.1 16S rRNA (cytosine(967)-C(5))-methyltransferase RsmB [Entomomonas asaccharolytica]
MNPRLAACKALTPVLQNKASLASTLPIQLALVEETNKALVQELTLGTARWQPRLELLLNKLLEKPLKNSDKDIEALLYIGLYQLLYMRTPAHAAINETVSCVTTLKKLWAKGLVNAVLRNCQRESADIFTSLAKDPVEFTAHPRWLQKRLKQDWPDNWQAICEANNIHPPMTLRVNTRHTTRENYLNLLNEANLQATPCSYSTEGIQLLTPCPVNQLPYFVEGWLSVQDEAAQLAAHLLELKPQQRVLDACCAPGGKTCHILELQPQLIEVVAIDAESSRLERVTENLQRLNLQATLKVADGRDTANWWDSKPFDRILLDAPCSATGVIRRHPDIKLTRKEQDITPLATLQRELLTAIWPTLAVGGILVYATCSVIPEENTENIQKFLADHSNARELDIGNIGFKQPCGRQLFPQIDGHDGFYYAKLIKIAK